MGFLLLILLGLLPSSEVLPATEDLAPERASSPWSPWGARGSESPAPAEDAVEVEAEPTTEHPPAQDVPDRGASDAAGGGAGGSPEVRPSTGDKGGTAGANLRAPPTDFAQASSSAGTLALSLPLLTATVRASGAGPPTARLAATGQVSAGSGVFNQVRQAVDLMEQGFNTCQAELRSREADLHAIRERLEQAEASFQQVVRETTERHQADEAAIAIEALKLTTLRAATQGEIADLNALRKEVQVAQGQLDADRAAAATRDAEVESRHQKQLAAQAQVLRDELQLEFSGALASRDQEYRDALGKQEESAKALREELSATLASNSELQKVQKKLEDEVVASTARLAEMAQREVALQEKLDAAQGELSKKEEKNKELRLALVTARHEIDKARENLVAANQARHQDSLVLRRSIDGVAEAMRQVGLFPEKLRAHPGDDSVADLASFIAHLAGQLDGVKEVLTDSKAVAQLKTELAGKISELEKAQEDLAASKQRNTELDRAHNSLLRDRLLEAGELDAVAVRASTTMQRFGGNPVEWDKNPVTASIREYVQFFGFVVDFLAGLKGSLDEILVQEGRQVGEFVATRLLSRLHHQDPSLRLEAIHEKIVPAATRTEAEAAVAPHVARVVAKLERQG